MAQNTVPLCSYQYERTFNTTRIPGVQTDKIVHFSDSTHITVYHAGRYFKMPCYYKGQLLNPKELQVLVLFMKLHCYTHFTIFTSQFLTLHSLSHIWFRSIRLSRFLCNNSVFVIFFYHSTFLSKFVSSVKRIMKLATPSTLSFT